MISATLALLLVEVPALVAAYEWQFTAQPESCSDVTIEISGDGGQPPYRALIIPYGSSPFDTEVRRIMDVEFDGSSSNTTFRLNYPANSQFITVVSDASGFASGGTSVGTQVADSDDDSCYDESQSVSPDFFYSIEPPNQYVQCQPMRIWWDPATVQGNPIFLGVISGGQSFVIPQGEITEVPSQGTGFTWTPNLRAGTEFTIVGGDDRGNGTAGSSTNLIGGGTSQNSSCLSDQSPSSTAGDPAGGYPTNTGGGGGGGGGGSSDDDSGGSDVGAIVGGVVGGVVGVLALVLLLLFFRRRSKLHKQQKEKPVDLLQADEGDDRPGNHSELPQYYQPEPFIVPDPTSGEESTSDGRPLSYAPTSRSGTPDLLSAGASTSASTTARKGGAPRPLRPVNIIQHDDAGPGDIREEEPETIELPPAYTKINRSDVGTPGSEGGGPAAGSSRS